MLLPCLCHLVCFTNCLDEGAQLSGIFLSPPRFDTGGHIDSPRMQQANSRADIFRVQASGYNHPDVLTDFCNQWGSLGPIESLTRSARLLCRARVEENRGERQGE